MSFVSWPWLCCLQRVRKPNAAVDSAGFLSRDVAGEHVPPQAGEHLNRSSSDGLPSEAFINKSSMLGTRLVGVQQEEHPRMQPKVDVSILL